MNEAAATFAGVVLTVASLVAGVGFWSARYRWEMRALPFVCLGLTGYIIASPLVSPWWPGGTLLMLLAIALLLSLSARLTELIASTRGYIRAREGAPRCSMRSR